MKTDAVLSGAARASKRCLQYDCLRKWPSGAAFATVALLFTTLTVQAQQAAPKPAVTVAPVTRQAVADRDVYTGRVVAESKIEIRARVAGFVQSRPFREGGPVKAGDTLFTIERTAYEAAVTQIQGQIRSAQAQKELADIEVERQKTLFRTKTVAEAVVQKAVAAEGEIDGKLLELQGSLQRAELDLSYTTITAPFSGRIGLAAANVGDFVDASSGSLATLSSIDPIYVVFPVPEAAVLDFRTAKVDGKPATPPVPTITLSNGTTYPEPGVLDFLDVKVQEGTDTVLVRAVFVNPGGILIDGQLVNVTLTTEGQTKPLTMPVQALQRNQAGYFTMVVDAAGKVEMRPIALERVVPPLAVIAKGLKEGELVVTGGANKIRPGMTVDAAEEPVLPATKR